MRCSAFVGIVSLLVAIGDSAPVDLDESVSVEISFSMPWSEFCLLRDYFKTKLAEELIDDDWQTISPSRVVLHDIDKRCAPKQKANDQVEDLVVFISEPGPSADKVDVAMTQKTYKVLHHVWKNRIDGPLGAVFRNKITNVEAEGVEAPAKPSGLSETSRTFVAIGIAVAVIAAILIVMGIVYFCKKLLKKKENEKSGDHNAKSDDGGIDNRVVEGDPEAQPDEGVAVMPENANQPIKPSREEDDEYTQL